MLQNVRAGCREHAAACADQVASTRLAAPLGMRSSRAYVAATILASMITFGSAPSIAAAQSHVPPCSSDRNQLWTDCTGVYTYPDGSRYVGEFRDNKRSGQGTLTFANGDKFVGQWSDGKENGQGTYTFSDGDKYVGEWHPFTYSLRISARASRVPAPHPRWTFLFSDIRGTGDRWPSRRSRCSWRRRGATGSNRSTAGAAAPIVAGVLPKELDATLSLDVNLFAECRSFAQAFRLARDHIGADEPLMIEAEATDDPD